MFVRMALSPNAGLKLVASLPNSQVYSRQNGAKPERKGSN